MESVFSFGECGLPLSSNRRVRNHGTSHNLVAVVAWTGSLALYVPEIVTIVVGALSVACEPTPNRCLGAGLAEFRPIAVGVWCGSHLRFLHRILNERFLHGHARHAKCKSVCALVVRLLRETIGLRVVCGAHLPVFLDACCVAESVVTGAEGVALFSASLLNSFVKIGHLVIGPARALPSVAADLWEAV